MSIYDGADQAIREMNRRNLKSFNRLKLAKWDEINLVRAVSHVYDESSRLARQKYYEIAAEAFIVAAYQAKVEPRRAAELADDIITVAWVMGILDRVDPVTLYAFTSETERKKERLIEALSAAQNRNYEIDKALRYWTAQVAQYATTTVDEAVIAAFRAAGVEKVVWHTAQDEKVCNDCEPLDGREFSINEIPVKPHWGCRCELEPVLS